MLYTLHRLQCRVREIGGISAGAAGHTLQRGVGTGAPGSNTTLAGELLFLRLRNIVCMTHRRADPSAGQKVSYFATYVKSEKADREVTSCLKPDLLKGWISCIQMIKIIPWGCFKKATLITSV